MEIFVQQLFNGLTVGSVYSLVALGLTLVYGILHIPNFAHGALYMTGGYITLTMMTKAGLYYWFAIIVSVLVVGLIGVLMERFVFYPLKDAPPIHDKIAAIGILLFLEAFAQFVWGADYQTMPTPYGQVVTVLGLTFTVQRILIIVSTIVIMILLYFFLINLHV